MIKLQNKSELYPLIYKNPLDTNIIKFIIDNKTTGNQWLYSYSYYKTTGNQWLYSYYKRTGNQWHDSYYKTTGNQWLYSYYKTTGNQRHDSYYKTTGNQCNDWILIIDNKLQRVLPTPVSGILVFL
jgi:hypothetical protein